MISHLLKFSILNFFYFFNLTVLYANGGLPALLIANHQYNNPQSKDPSLAKSIDDTQKIADELTSIGFRLIEGKVHVNLTKEKTLSLILAFQEELNKTNEIGFFYYAGYGVEVGNDQYLIPPTLENKITDENALTENGISISEIMVKMMGNPNNKLILIWDAPRQNPFNKALSNHYLSIDLLQNRENFIVLYTTSAGEKKFESDTSIFVDLLIENLKVVNTPLKQMFNKIIESTQKKTNNKQNPKMEGSISSDLMMPMTTSEKPIFADPKVEKAMSKALMRSLFGKRLKIKEPVLAKGCNPKNINTINARKSGLLYCFEKINDKTPQLLSEGKIVVQVQINTDGKSSNIWFSENTVANENLDNCIMNTFKRWVFEPHSKTCELSLSMKIDQINPKSNP